MNFHTKEKVAISWSGGKDSAMSLYEIQRSRKYKVSTLLTTITEDYDRISMHGVRRALLEIQAESLGLPLYKVYISPNSTNEEYESKMRETLLNFQKPGISSIIFGDLFLEDVRRYREENLSRVGMKGIFPLWKRDKVVETFINLGFKSIVTCIDQKVMDKSFLGRIIDREFLAELPPQVDPNGENGEFHSFAFDGPIFKKRIKFVRGEIVARDSLYFCDLLPIK